MTWWRELPADEPFGLDNLPYAVADLPGGTRVVSRVAGHAVDLARLAEEAGMESGVVWDAPSLIPFLDAGPDAWGAARTWLQEILRSPEHDERVAEHLYAVPGLTLRLPVEIGDYVDFYASEHHATNVGRMFRPDSAPLTPNWKHLPIGYHGRSGTVVVSGTDIVRPCGQRKGTADPAPVFGPSVRLDIECELGFVVGGASALGSPVPLAQAWDHIFGVVLLDDWSARDIQAWEYVPLGPFLGKSFATSISAWVVPMAALDAARVALPGQDPAPLPYLAGDAAYGLDVRCDIEWNGTVVSRPSYADMYWSPAQMLAHLTVNGASIRSGDLFGSGTISGPDKGSRGCFLELTWSGAEPVTLADGSTRTFLEDGDTVVLRATAPGPGGTVVGLGDCVGRVLPAAAG
ncbi:MAG: fumarylacetoacetase [Dermatophilaceae bacterium]